MPTSQKDAPAIQDEKKTGRKTPNLEDLSPKLQQQILKRLDFHSLLKCRVLSKNLKTQVDKVIESSQLSDRKLKWNPYFTVRRYFDLNTRNLFGFVRFESAADVKRFVEENAPAAEQEAANSVNTPTDIASPTNDKSSSGVPAKSVKITIPTPAASSPTTKPVSKTKRPPQGKSMLQSLDSEFLDSPAGLPPVESPKLPTSNLFPLGSLHIRRRLQDYVEEDKKSSSPPADTNEAIIYWTTCLVQSFGTQLTSFTFDDGKRKGSDLSFAQLSALLAQMPNLVFLGVTSGNYEHHNFDKNFDTRRGVERLPPLADLKYASLGYNTTHHLHKDILNSYGRQLKRLTCSKFGYVYNELNISTNNTLQKLLDYCNSIRDIHPNTLSSLEELKSPILSSQNLMHEVLVVAAASPILWSNLKRLSLHYLYNGCNNCAMADVCLFINVLSPTLEELCLDFESCSHFVEWMSVDPRPLSRDVHRPCRRIRKLSIAACSLLKFSDLSVLISSKFPNLKTLTFFNWWLYRAEAGQNNFQGKYFSGGPREPDNLPLYMEQFWTKCSGLQRASVRIETWKYECVYSQSRDEALLV